ncbi:hypothetical protein CR513_48914, partial [Mucuna pruriens]
MKHPTKDHSIFSIDIIDELVEEYKPIGTTSANFSNFVEIPNEAETDSKSQPKAGFNSTHTKSKQVEAESDFGQSSPHSDRHFPVIIANNLNQEQEEKLLNVLQKHQKILLEEEAQPIRQQQRRLNPTILDMVKKEVTRLVAVEIIYPISDSQWLSSIQVVPKKSGMTVMKDWHDEMMLTHI